MQSLTISTPDLITFTEAARLLGVSRPSVYNLERRHRLHAVVFGRNRYLMRSEVEYLKNKLEDSHAPHTNH